MNHLVRRNEQLPNQWYPPQRVNTYGGNHTGGIERGDDHVSYVGVRPFQQNRPDTNWVNGHPKPWTLPPPETGRHFEPYHRVQNPGYYTNSKTMGYTQR